MKKTILNSITIGFLLLGFVKSDDSDSRIVSSPQGPIRGYKEDGLFIFYDIPYATAPTGVYKFTAPIEPPTWTETFDAVNKYIICPGVVSQEEYLTITEDCLVTTIFVPDTNETNLPVVVFIHGGAYVLGFGNSATPKQLVASGRVIAVTFNYRLGVHGFLCLGTDKAPGNAGMKDQIALLRWVNKNIASFGGNPDDVTLGGYSAGASAVDLIILSDMAKGLFRKVIVDSGANLSPWSIQPNPLQIAKDHAIYHGFDNVEDMDALENFFTSASWDELMVDISNTALNTNSMFSFVPCIERDIGQELFLSIAPITILKEGKFQKYPMLYGFSEMEGEFRIMSFDDWKNSMNEKFSDFLPGDLHFETSEVKELVAEEVRQFYFGNLNVGNETARAYIDYFTDVIFSFGMLRSVNLQINSGNDRIFLYEYMFDAEEWPPIMPRLNIRGAGHCYQSFIVLDTMDLSFSRLSNRTAEMAGIMRDLWLNFITNGVPTHEGSSVDTWLPVSGTLRSPHMSLDLPPSARGPLLQRRAEFWDGIYDKYYRVPQAPNQSHGLHIQPILILMLTIKTLIKTL